MFRMHKNQIFLKMKKNQLIQQNLVTNHKIKISHRVRILHKKSRIGVGPLLNKKVFLKKLIRKMI